MKNKNNTAGQAQNLKSLEQRRKYVEMAASAGLMLVLVAMMVPFFQMFPSWVASAAKWVYAVGALTYTVARVVNVNAPDDPLRLRRLRRLEFWAGMCFIVGGAFWFYKLQYYDGILVGPLAVMQQTVAFTMAGAVIQIVAGVMISRVVRKMSK